MTIDPEKIERKSEDVGLDTGHSDDKKTTASIASSTRDVDDDSIDIVPERILTTNGIPVDEEAAVATTKERARSQASSTRSRALSVVPRLKRRGFLAQLTLIPEVERPYDYPDKVKWTITVFIALAACAAPMGSAIFFPALPEMSKSLNASPTVVNLTVALYMLAMSIFPLWWSSFSETLGRRNIYLSSFFLNVVFSLLSGLSVNIAMLIVFRVLSGGAAASVQAVGAGTIADIWEPRERGRAMGYFYLGPLLGPLLAPIIGGALTEGFDWRGTEWFLTAYGAVVLVLILFCVPETLARRTPVTTVQTSPANDLSRVSTTRSVQVYTKKAAVWLKRCFLDPLEIIMYLRFPAVAITVYYAAITFGSLYILNISLQSSFSKEPYNYSAIIIGLLYLPGSLGYFAASMLGGRWIDRIMVRAAEKAQRYDANGKLVYLPEDRMRENAWTAATLYPGALIWSGWTLQYGIHWAAPSVANFFFGVGSMLVFSAATTMLTEFMPGRSSSGVALNNFVRNILSCTGGIVGQPLIDVMGVGWLMTLVGLVSWISGNVCIYFLRKNSRKWRAQMDKALNNK
ncbi:major facilitator superfamily transporter multidrug resistance [Annulohypoxylon maeteangense]|uniref:major facilitator superfamily transporter multidrug resistance n=1 Tax=Annulohypoxylon maeteangense TaxID=1927788 RepID=UPI0020083934|nr:major facilitator superfamily transporter multidrug resistance [Annulohypoxylon maeteangense]KAI0885830.1 major facilitator superfamily transporter multidrug resistance [Annulohypoxylon maeteangense]